MIDYRTNTIQQFLKNIIERYHGQYLQVGASTFDRMKVPNPDRMIRDYKLRASVGLLLTIHPFNIPAQSVSEINPFELPPKIWQRVNQPDVLYMFKVDISVFKHKLEVAIKKCNDAIQKNWDSIYQHHFYEQLTNDMFIMGSFEGQE